jgi:hypothetical protein
MPGVPQDISLLQRRVGEFLGSRTRGKEPLQALLEELAAQKATAIFGGMIRDICLGGARFFRSDVDVVIDAPAQWLSAWLARRCLPVTNNAFGGARLQLKGWQVDLWTLGSTWAIREGHVQARELSDLVKTTFFSWDAWVYEVGSKRIHPGLGTLEQMRANLVDINLEPNPRPRGALKALRWLEHRRAALTPRLAAYLYNQLEHHGDTPVGPARSFVERVRRDLAAYVADKPEQPFALPPGDQLTLPAVCGF